MADETDEQLLQEAIKQYEMEMLKDETDVSPTFQDKDSQYKMIRELMNAKKSIKVANLTSDELGTTSMSVRGMLRTSLMCSALDRPILATLFDKEAEIIAATSMSRYAKGANFLSLIFTQIKKSLTGTTDPKPIKKGLFSFGRNKGEPAND